MAEIKAESTNRRCPGCKSGNLVKITEDWGEPFEGDTKSLVIVDICPRCDYKETKRDDLKCANARPPYQDILELIRSYS